MTQESNVIWKKCDDHDVEPKYVVNMTISFTLPYPKCHSAIVRVLYGPTTPDSKDIIPTNKTLVVEETPIQFQYNASLAVPTLKEEYQSDYIYHVTLPELLAGRVEYWYIIQTEIEELRTLKFLDDEDHMIFGKRVDDNVTLRTMMLLSKVNTDMTFFHTPPLPPLATEEELSEEEEEETNEDQSSSFSSSSPTVLALVGDLGQTENSTKTMKHIYDGVIAGNISSVIIAGDLSYADGDPFRWTRWMELMVRFYVSLYMIMIGVVFFGRNFFVSFYSLLGSVVCMSFSRFSHDQYPLLLLLLCSPIGKNNKNNNNNKGTVIENCTFIFCTRKS